MKDTIVQQVCKARASVAADFDCNLGKFFAWASAHTAANALHKMRQSVQPAARLAHQDNCPMSVIWDNVEDLS